MRAHQFIHNLTQQSGQKPEFFGDGTLKGSNIVIQNNFNSNVVAYINGGNKVGPTPTKNLPQVPRSNSTMKNDLLQDFQNAALDELTMKKAKSHRANSTLNTIQNDQYFSGSKTKLGGAGGNSDLVMRENEELRYRIQQMDNYIRNMQETQQFNTGVIEETPPSKIDWARLLLDVETTEDMLITVNREKIGQELLRIRSENARLTSLINKMGGGGSSVVKKTPTL